MLSLLAITAFGTTDAPEHKRVRLPPLRLDHRVLIRPGTAGTVVTEVGVQAARSKLFAVDVNMGIAPAANLRLPGDVWWRNMATFSVGADLLWEPTPFISIGPSANIDLRWFRQQANNIGTTVIPNLGLRTNLHVLRGRRYSLAFTLKAMVDVVETEMIMETASIEKLQPISGQFGVRFNFGHGRYKGQQN